MKDPVMGVTPRTSTSSAAGFVAGAGAGATSSNSPPGPPPPPNPPPPPPPPLSQLAQPSNKKKNKPTKFFRVFRSVFRTLPIITPVCKFPHISGGVLADIHLHRGGVSSDRISGTLFGNRKGRASLLIQENPRTLPTAVVELAINTSMLQKEMSMGMVRIALECEKRAEKDKTPLLEEPMWTMYCNGKKSGYSVRREPNDEDVQVMELLRAVSMGAGVLPGRSEIEGPDGELAYVRAHFERVVGSKDSETLYMLSPDGNSGPDLSIFFVRI
ncbi:protein MIZU-KUSSEI 1-like [Impatiens glandulifera]|uniref:protein MIZU-KUSSEI 1-like n=1 Tax=Impatiens glandulifera TaxID=253017 RepID=UPI001FB155E0|nr:protein MIZU-KUSSEI 1-like [Impatiens glandulifera]